LTQFPLAPWAMIVGQDVEVSVGQLVPALLVGGGCAAPMVIFAPTMLAIWAAPAALGCKESEEGPLGPIDSRLIQVGLSE